jgi:hypothetical protein
MAKAVHFAAISWAAIAAMAECAALLTGGFSPSTRRAEQQ